MTRYSEILSTGRYVPERVLTNADLEAQLGETFDAWLRANVGIEQRHVMADDQVTSDLAAAAGRQALERAGVKPSEVDLIIVATDTPDYLSPATSSVVQHKLGATGAGTFDVNAACSGWVAALDVANKSIVADPECNKVLVIGAYGMTRFVDWKHRNTCTLFADGAGAVLLGASTAPGYLAGKMRAFGEMHDALGIYTGGTFRPATLENVQAHGKPTVQFVRKFPPTFNTDHWPALVQDTVRRAGMTLGDVQLFVFTQLNLRTIEAVMSSMGQPMTKTHWIMNKWGYTGSGCIPMTLDDAVASGKVRKGDHVVLCASGGGVSMACSVVRWTR